jgi:hypothetical protein
MMGASTWQPVFHTHTRGGCRIAQPQGGSQSATSCPTGCNCCHTYTTRARAAVLCMCTRNTTPPPSLLLHAGAAIHFLWVFQDTHPKLLSCRCRAWGKPGDTQHQALGVCTHILSGGHEQTYAVSGTGVTAQVSGCSKRRCLSHHCRLLLTGQALQQRPAREVETARTARPQVHAFDMSHHSPVRRPCSHAGTGATSGIHTTLLAQSSSPAHTQQ